MSHLRGRSRRTGHGRRGYSLVEAMITVTVIGILAMAGPRLMIQLQNFYLMTTARNEIQRDARVCLDIINRFLRQGKYRTIIVDTPSGQGPYSRIRFDHVDGRRIEFRQQGSKLIQAIGGASTTIASNLSYIAFTFPRSDDPTIISVSMTMAKSIQRGQRKALELTIQKVRVMN
ncbi:MAG: prepilin-type N-terminal cleavage/methylation domain-containing protein [Elusimicrobiota bacterium]